MITSLLSMSTNTLPCFGGELIIWRGLLMTFLLRAWNNVSLRFKATSAESGKIYSDFVQFKATYGDIRWLQATFNKMSCRKTGELEGPPHGVQRTCFLHHYWQCPLKRFSRFSSCKRHLSNSQLKRSKYSISFLSHYGNSTMLKCFERLERCVWQFRWRYVTISTSTDACC